MAVKLRLSRLGRRNRPFYRLVAADSRRARDGRILETLGNYDPLQEPAGVVVDEEKVLKWLDDGAEMSETVRAILSREGVLKRWHESRFGAPQVGEEREETETGKEKEKKPAPGKKPRAKKEPAGKAKKKGSEK